MDLPHLENASYNETSKIDSSIFIHAVGDDYLGADLALRESYSFACAAGSYNLLAVPDSVYIIYSDSYYSQETYQAKQEFHNIHRFRRRVDVVLQSWLPLRTALRARQRRGDDCDHYESDYDVHFRRLVFPERLEPAGNDGGDIRELSFDGFYGE